MSALDEVINNAPAPSPYDPTPTPAPVVLPGVKEAIAGLDGIPGLVAQFKEADVPHANPPEAAKVLETQTLPEVAGEPEPLTDEQKMGIVKATELNEFNEARVARGEKALKRMPPEKKTRRTAPVVQVELDAALAKIAKLEAAIPAPAVTEMSEMECAKLGLISPLGAALAEIAELKMTTAGSPTDELRVGKALLKSTERELEVARAEIERLNALPMTASAVQDRDETIAKLRGDLECARGVISDLEPGRPESSTPMEILVDECESRGWKVTLSR